MPVSLRTSPGSRNSGSSPLRPFDARPRRTLSVVPAPDGPIEDQGFVEYFRCPLDLAPVTVSEGLSADEGFFTFGDTVCYGRSRGGPPSRNLVGAAAASRAEEFDTTLPFDLSEIVRNLRQERYTQGSHATSMTARAVRHVYTSSDRSCPYRAVSICRRSTSVGGIALRSRAGRWTSRSSASCKAP